jgi:ABC-type methionine transport system ATPase subunit
MLTIPTINADTFKAIARAVYSHSKLVLCDDVLSGLDPTTEEIVFRRVFAKTGILQRMGISVILATHSGMFMGLFLCRNHLLTSAS